MKLHNLLLASALFLSAGIVLAQGKGQGQGKKAFDASDLKTQSSYRWSDDSNPGPTHENLVKYSVLDVRMIRMNGNSTSSDTGWSYLVSGYKNGTKMETELSNGVYVENPDISADLEGSGLTQEQIDTIADYARNHGVFDFQISFGNDKTVDYFGLVGTVNKKIDSVNNTTEHKNDNKFYTLGDSNILYYGSSNNFPNNGAIFIVSAHTNVSQIDPVINGKPLPAPVTTLLIALGFGAALVMYRNRKVKA